MKEEGNQARAKHVFGFTRMYNEKIREREACDKEGPTKWEDALSLSNELCSLQKLQGRKNDRYRTDFQV